MTKSGCALVVAAILWSSRAFAADIQATPSDYGPKVNALAPGDTLHLAAGTYQNRLNISGLNGTETAPITITGPDSGAPAVIVADPGPCCNTVEISDSSYVILKNVTIDGNHVDGAFGVSAKSGTIHHITIDGCHLINHDGGQQHDGISTKVPTWGWVIRNNWIEGVGTGLYLGNSDGSDPFIGGVIENNLVKDPIGYCMEIKWQQPRPSVPGMPTGPSTTVIRNNVFIKNDGPSPDGDRPNILVGGFPDSGAGSQDLYEIYGNFLFHNPRESLFQGSGRVSLHDNVFVDSAYAAIRLQNHDLPLKSAHVYNNTIYSVATGIGFSNSAPDGDLVLGNLVFSGNPISGSIQNQADNMTDTVANAGNYVANPSLALGSMDFYPLTGQCQGSALDLGSVSSELDYALDFNGTSKGGFTFRGAYAGEGQNSGWQLDADLKSGGGVTPPVGGSGGGGAGGVATGGATNGGAANGGSGATASGGQPGSGGASAKPGGESDDGGCGCRAAGATPRSFPLGFVALALALARRRRRAAA
jgi:MYXO-CTERM domain-containing protein